MKLPPFHLEQYLGKYEFRAPHILCSSDSETWTVDEVLSFESGSKERLNQLGLGYMMSEGNPELLTALTKLYENITTENLVSFAGAEEGIFAFLNTFLTSADHVIGHWPCYQSLLEIPRTLGCEITLWEARESQGWSLAFEQLKSSIKKNTKLIILNSPHNPTGYLMERNQFQELIRIADINGIYILSDEVYRGLEYHPEDRLPPMASQYERGLSLGVMSKGYGLPGLRVGWIAAQNKKLIQDCVSFKHYTSICNAAPSEFLAAIALRNSETVLMRNREIIFENLKLLDSFFSKHSNQFSWQRPKAGCIAFPRILNRSARSFCADLLESKGLLLAPSENFEFGDSHFRIGFGKRSFAKGFALLEEYIHEQN